jgi:alcohol dehydrogenase (cytochrome c)
MKHSGLTHSFARTTLGLALALSGLSAWAVTDDDILKDAQTPGEVVTNGLGLQGQRYSTLDTLNADNVTQLRPVWAFSFGGEKQRGQQAQPLVKDGVMYMTASYSRVFAVDAKTGKELWQYDARLPDGIMPCCDVINRGVALYGDLVIFGTLDAKLVALNKDTGKVVWKKTVADYKAGYSITAAPLVVNGKLITGVSGGEFGVVGKIEAYNPKNGELLWTRPTVEATWATSTRTASRSRTASPAARPASPGRATCGRPAARRRGWAATTIRKPTSCCSAPATRRRGTRTCARATTCTPPRVWR